MKLLLLFLISLNELSNAHINIASDLNKVVGYVGPACVVVDDLFYLHGHFMRRLVPEEVFAFKKYQNTLSLLRQLRDAISKGATLLNNGTISLPTPTIPEFCNGFDDTAEVVLDGCVVRGNHLYIADRLIRPINLIEKQRINTILASFLTSPTMRERRSVDEKTSNDSTEAPKTSNSSTEAPKTSKNSSETPKETATEFQMSEELKELISNTFNVNANVTERFLPIAQMSPLFSHFMRQGEQLFEPSNDDPRASYYPPAFVDTLKAQKVARSAVPANLNTATEIPHLYVDDRNANTANQQQLANGQLNPFDPILIQFLRSLANRQQNVNEIIRQQKMIQQQLQQSQVPVGQAQQPFGSPPIGAQQSFGSPPIGAQQIKAGETMLIGGQPYTAVQLNPESPGAPSIGLVPASSASSTHTVTALPPAVNNWMPHLNHYGPNAGMPFNGYGPNMMPMIHEAIRYHPGKRTENVPLFVNGIPLPHEICRAHLMDPFVWSRT